MMDCLSFLSETNGCEWDRNGADSSEKLLKGGETVKRLNV